VVEAGTGKSDWNEVDAEYLGVDSRDKVRHNERSNHLYVTRMMLVAEQQ